jgi:hypothetical protein
LAIHAHVMAAKGYMDEARRSEDYSLPMPADAGGGGGEAASDAALPDQEERAMRESTRAAAATILTASGDVAGAHRLLHLRR